MRRGMHRDMIFAHSLTPDTQRDQLRHRAAGHEYGSRLAQQSCDSRFERCDEFAVAVPVGMRAVRAAPFSDAHELLTRPTERMTGNVHDALSAQRFLLLWRERGSHAATRSNRAA